MRVQPCGLGLAGLDTGFIPPGRLAGPLVSRAADQDKVPVTIAAVDIAFLINLEIDFRMAQRSGNIAAAVTGNTAFAHANCFGNQAHDRSR